jgi:hypothetical protein
MTASVGVDAGEMTPWPVSSVSGSFHLAFRHVSARPQSDEGLPASKWPLASMQVPIKHDHVSLVGSQLQLSALPASFT